MTYSTLNWDRKHKKQVNRNQSKCDRKISTRFTSARYEATEFNRVWFITLEEYTRLLNEGCFYCGNDLLNLIGVGLDRIDNKEGYTNENTLPCCGQCNKMRNNVLTVEEMQGAMLRVLEIRDAKVRQEFMSL